MIKETLAKPVRFDFLRVNAPERIAFGILLLWCILPAAMVIPTIVYGSSDIFVQAGLYARNGLLSQDCLKVFRRAFLVLGSISIVFAALQIAINRQSLFRKENLKRSIWFFLLVGLLIWSAVSTALSDDPLQQFRGSSYRCDGLFSYFIYGAILCCALSIESEQLKRVLALLFVSVVNVLCVIMLLEAAEVLPFRLMFQTPYAAVFNNQNHFAYVLCMSGLCAASMYLHEESTLSRVFYLLSLSFQVFTLLVNDTFGCYLAMVVGFAAIVLLWVKSGRTVRWRLFVPIVIFVALSAMSCLGCFSSIDHGNVGASVLGFFSDVNATVNDAPDAGRAGSGRLRLWVEALNMIPERPIFGYGPEGLMGEYATKMGLDRPHNEVIQYAVFLGIPGLLLYLSALVSLAVKQWRSLKQLPATTLMAMAVVVGYFVSSLFGNTMFNTAPYFWMMLGFAACSPVDGAFFQQSSHQVEVESDKVGESVAPAAPSAARMIRIVVMAVVIAILIILGFTL